MATNTPFPLRWAISSTGAIAERFADALGHVPGAQLVAVGSRTQARADQFADQVGIPRRHGSAEALAADPDVDVVYVASPHAHHHHDTKLFLEAGKHVLVEKPIALDAAQAKDMVDTARAAGRFLMEAVWSRFLPAYQRMYQLVGDGQIGRLLSTDADFGFPFGATGFSADHRLVNRSLGGGALLDLGIYPVQLAHWLFGAPTSVHAVAAVDGGIDLETAVTMAFAGSQVATARCSLRGWLTNTGRVFGETGIIELPVPHHAPDHLLVSEMPAGFGAAPPVARIDCPMEGNGMNYEAIEVHRCIAAGKLESDTMPHAASLAIMTILDRARAEIGVVYET